MPDLERRPVRVRLRHPWSRSRAAIVGVLIGCGRLGFDASGDAVASGDGAGDGDLAPPGSAAVTGKIALKVPSTSWSPIDLTSTGTIDWIAWGWGGIAMTDRKAGVVPAIEGWAQIGGGAVLASDMGYPAFTWTDGTPRTIANPADQFVYLDTSGLNGDGFRFVVKGSATTRTLSLYAGSWCARLRIAASVDDITGTRTWIDSTWDNAGQVGEAGTYDIRFQTASPGETMTVELTIDFNYCTTGDLGEVWLGGASLH